MKKRTLLSHYPKLKKRKSLSQNEDDLRNLPRPNHENFLFIFENMEIRAISYIVSQHNEFVVKIYLQFSFSPMSNFVGILFFCWPICYVSAGLPG